MHYKRWWRYGDPLYVTVKVSPPCSIDGCSSVAHGRGWCAKHYKRWLRYGDPMVVKGPPVVRRPPRALSAPLPDTDIPPRD